MEFVLLLVSSLIAGGLGGGLVSARLFSKWADRFVRTFQNDEAVFARVVRQFYQDDPVLTHGVWKKVFPDIVPPWHRKEGREG